MVGMHSVDQLWPAALDRILHFRNNGSIANMHKHIAHSTQWDNTKLRPCGLQQPRHSQNTGSIRVHHHRRIDDEMRVHRLRDFISLFSASVRRVYYALAYIEMSTRSHVDTENMCLWIDFKQSLRSFFFFNFRFCDEFFLVPFFGVTPQREFDEWNPTEYTRLRRSTCCSCYDVLSVWNLTHVASADKPTRCIECIWLWSVRDTIQTHDTYRRT